MAISLAFVIPFAVVFFTFRLKKGATNSFEGINFWFAEFIENAYKEIISLKDDNATKNFISTKEKCLQCHFGLLMDFISLWFVSYILYAIVYLATPVSNFSSQVKILLFLPLIQSLINYIIAKCILYNKISNIKFLNITYFVILSSYFAVMSLYLLNQFIHDWSWFICIYTICSIVIVYLLQSLSEMFSSASDVDVEKKRNIFLIISYLFSSFVISILSHNISFFGNDYTLVSSLFIIGIVSIVSIFIYFCTRLRTICKPSFYTNS